MDPKDQKIKELEEELAAKTTELETATKERDAANEAVKTKDTEIEGLTKTIQEKDVVIEQKNQDIVGARKKFSEMTETEKAKLTEQEQELARRQEELDNNMKKFEENQNNFFKTQRESARDAAIRKFAGEDKDLIEKIKFNFDQLKGSEAENDPTKIADMVGTAANMLGENRPDPIIAANGAGGGGNPDDSGGNKDYSESDEGKGLASTLGLTQTQASAQNGGGEAT